MVNRPCLWQYQRNSFDCAPGRRAKSNIRLSCAQIGYIATNAEDAVVIVDASLVPLLA